MEDTTLTDNVTVVLTDVSADELVTTLRSDPLRSDELLVTPLGRFSDEEIANRFKDDRQPLVHSGASWADALD
jgi:hypothetical protein